MIKYTLVSETLTTICGIIPIYLKKKLLQLILNTISSISIFEADL